MAIIKTSNDTRSHSSFLPVIAGLLVAASIYLVGTSTMSQVAGQEALSSRGNVVEARLSKGTESLVKQLATHMSKLLGGESIGGFPGFEPPEDDEKYREKIRNQSYTPEEANYWIKEINNILRQMVKKNPDMTLEEILHRMGLNTVKTNELLGSLRDIHVTARNMAGYGVDREAVSMLEELMDALGVVPWPL